MKYRLIDTDISDAPWNMSVDEALLNNFTLNDTPIIRIYSWEPSLSFGRFSNVFTNIKTDNLHSISYVRRLTGGGILVHGGDISYSIIIPREFLKNKGVKESFRYLCSFLMKFYETIGLEPKYTFESDRDICSSDVCLLGNETYDIMIDGKKMGGNAQRHKKEVIFQHGSIPLYYDENFFENFFLDSSGIDGAFSLKEAGIDKNIKELKELLIDSFSETFKCEIYKDNLNEKEITDAKELLESRYNLDNWNIDGKHY